MTYKGASGTITVNILNISKSIDSHLITKKTHNVFPICQAARTVIGLV